MPRMRYGWQMNISSSPLSHSSILCFRLEYETGYTIYYDNSLIKRPRLKHVALLPCIAGK